MKKIKRAFSLLIGTIIITCSSISQTQLSIVMAEESQSDTMIESDDDVKEGQLSNGLTYLYNDKKAVISGYVGSEPNVTIPSDINGLPVTNIAPSAFMENETIENMVIEANITNIPEDCFWGCYNLKTCTLPESVTTIELGAFGWCGFEEFTVPDSVTEIGKDVFNCCNEMTKLTVGKNVTSFEGFGSCNKLKEIVFNCEKVSAFTISDCPALENIVLPLKVGLSNSFSNCTSLQFVTILDGAKYIRGDNFFYGCTQLSGIYIPKSVTSIDKDVFKYVPLITIYGHTGSYAQEYASNHGLDFVAVESSENIMFNKIEQGTTSNGIKYIKKGEQLLITGYNFSKKTDELVIPNIIEGNIVTGIYPEALANIENVNTLRIEAEVNEIPEACCRSSKFKTIILPSTVKVINESAFNFCYDLENIEIPDGTETIETCAFFECSKLKSISIPDTVKNIGLGCFSTCEALTNITLPKDLSVISESMFYGCKSLTNIELPSGITTIQNCAFHSCTALKSLIIPSNTITIGESAFEGCSIMTNIYIPSSVQNIGNDAFKSCDYLKIHCEENSTAETYAKDNNLNYTYEPFETGEPIDGYEGWFRYVVNGNKCTIYPNNIPEKYDLVIPAEIGGYKVTDLGDFSKNVFETVNIQAEIEKIPDSCFWDNDNLKQITFPNTLKTIGNGAFCSCELLGDVAFPDSLEYIGDSAFAACPILNITHWSTSLKNFGWMTFNESGLKKVVLPNNIEDIGTAFYSTGIENITLPSTLTGELSMAFSQCYELKNIVLPEGITKLSSGAFENCEKLSYIYIPDTVEQITNTVFNNCFFLEICAPKDSYAIRFAKKKSIPYVEITYGEDNESFMGEIGSDVIDNAVSNDISVPVVSNQASAIFDSGSVIQIQHRHGNKQIIFNYNVVDLNEVSDTQLDAAEEATNSGGKLVGFNLVDDSGEDVIFNSSENEGTVTITIPYTAPVSANIVKVYYITEQGEKQDMNGVYDPSTKTVTFTTTHFSLYSIETDAATGILGDINEDGHVNDEDVTIYLKYLNNTHLLTPTQLSKADVNQDEQYNLLDIIAICNKTEIPSL